MLLMTCTMPARRTFHVTRSDAFKATVDEDVTDAIFWRTGEGAMKQARLPRVIFVR
jgi:hypothetical protein